MTIHYSGKFGSTVLNKGSYMMRYTVFSIDGVPINFITFHNTLISMESNMTYGNIKHVLIMSIRRL